MRQFKAGDKVRILATKEHKICKGLVGTTATIYSNKDNGHLRLRFDEDKVKELDTCSTCGLLKHFELELVEEETKEMEKQMYNGMEVKEYIKDGGGEVYTLVNGKKVYILESNMGVSAIDAISIIDAHTQTVTMEVVRDNDTLTASASAEELDGQFLPFILQKIATARLLAKISKESIKEIRGFSNEERSKLELVLTLQQVTEMSSK